MFVWLDWIPDMVRPPLESLLIVGGCYLGGHLLKKIICSRLLAFAGRTQGKWDDLLTEELSRRIPFWSLLAGGYLSAAVWTLPPRVASALDRGLFVALVLSLTFLTAGVVVKLTSLYGTTIHETLPVTSLTQNIARVAIVIVGVLIILNGLGLSITPILTALGVGGLAVALALQDTLANLFAGVYLILAQQIRVRDYIGLENGQNGYVADIGWRATRIQMLPNNMVIVPNAKLAQSIITNYYEPDKELAVPVEVGVDYGSDLDHVERVTREVGREVMKRVPGGVDTFEPVVRYHTFGESSIGFTASLRGREFADQFLLRHEFLKLLHARYLEEGIRIPHQTRTIVHHQGPAEVTGGQ